MFMTKIRILNSINSSAINQKTKQKPHPTCYILTSFSGIMWVKLTILFLPICIYTGFLMQKDILDIFPENK